MEENYFYIRNYKNILEIIKDADYKRPFNLVICNLLCES